MKTKIRIGNAGGFWGDDLNAFNRQLIGGELDYIVADYLAEITMSILRKQNIKNPELGYVTDFVDQILDNAELIVEKNVKIISNAGGINPYECAKKIIQGLHEKNINLKICIVDGDNIYDKIDEFYPKLTSFKNLETKEDFKNIKELVESANVYLGLLPIVKALENGADIIIAGRITDTTLTMAPAFFEFGWKINDWNKIATSLIAGHIIECGAQASGGNYTDWHKVKKWDNFGYPIINMFNDGTFEVTKHEGTGGLINTDVVKEQLLYEMGDPCNYISPDVVVDFTTIQLEANGPDCVKVYGIKGKPSTSSYKVSMSYRDGYKASGSIIISGNNALDKAKTMKSLFWKRLNLDFEKTNTEYVGYNACHKNLAPVIEPNEILLKFSVYDYDKTKIEDFSKSIAPIILSSPLGVSVIGGRPAIQSVMAYWPALIDKKNLNSFVKILDNKGEIEKTIEVSSVTGFENNAPQSISSSKQISSDNYHNTKIELPDQNTIKVKLNKICLARSGDKGNMVNIGVIARSKEIYDFINKHITADFIKDMFKEMCKGKVTRFELDNLLAMNFLLDESLDGGGTKSLMIDAQGKTFASAFLNQDIEIDPKLLDSI
ncbi:MAG: DUF1446 domain-containing protein [Bacteroidales bacterium]|jgi:hypothetical protein|nr:DUF1446 domain-containing protein [Bacteroidales bacterium]